MRAQIEGVTTTILWSILALYVVGAVFFGTRTVVRTLRAFRSAKPPLSVTVDGPDQQAARRLLRIGMVIGGVIATLRYSLLWPWDAVRRLGPKKPDMLARAVFTLRGEPVQVCRYTVQEGDDLEQILSASLCKIDEVAALNGGAVDWTPGSVVTLPRAVCFYLLGRSPRDFGEPPPKLQVH